MRRIRTAPIINTPFSKRTFLQGFDEAIDVTAKMGLFMLCIPVCAAYVCFKNTRPAIAGGALLGAVGGGCVGFLPAVAGSVVGSSAGLATYGMFKGTTAVARGIASLCEDSAPKSTTK